MKNLGDAWAADWDGQKLKKKKKLGRSHRELVMRAAQSALPHK